MLVNSQPVRVPSAGAGPHVDHRSGAQVGPRQLLGARPHDAYRMPAGPGQAGGLDGHVRTVLAAESAAEIGYHHPYLTVVQPERGQLGAHARTVAECRPRPWRARPTSPGRSGSPAARARCTRRCTRPASRSPRSRPPCRRRRSRVPGPRDPGRSRPGCPAGAGTDRPRPAADLGAPDWTQHGERAAAPRAVWARRRDEIPVVYQRHVREVTDVAGIKAFQTAPCAGGRRSAPCHIPGAVRSDGNRLVPVTAATSTSARPAR